MKIKLLISFLAPILLFVACDTKTPEEKELIHERSVKRTVQSVTYAKDERTGLCFGYIWAGYHGGPALTMVPCEAVEKYLVK